MEQINLKNGENLTADVSSIVFTVSTPEGQRPVGRLFLKDGTLSFDGDADASAKVFLDQVNSTR